VTQMISIKSSYRYSFQRVVYLLTEWFDRIAWLCLVIMMLLAVVNVILRLIGRPMQGAVELTSFLSALVMGFALSYCIIVKGHIRVQIIVDRLPERLRQITYVISSILSFAVLATMFWATANLSLDMWGEVSVILKIYFAPFIAAISACCLLACLAVITDLVKSVSKIKEIVT
jgi:TRAP-type C4-dicarboxylate transport system permease small subunit